MATKRRKTHKSARKPSGATSISHAARHALAAKGFKICHRKKPSAYNKRVGACLRKNGTGKAAFRKCAAQAAGRASPRARSGGRKKASSVFSSFEDF
jgi:hypothetical protein